MHWSIFRGGFQPCDWLAVACYTPKPFRTMSFGNSVCGERIKNLSDPIYSCVTSSLMLKHQYKTSHLIPLYPIFVVFFHQYHSIFTLRGWTFIAPNDWTLVFTVSDPGQRHSPSKSRDGWRRPPPLVRWFSLGFRNQVWVCLSTKSHIYLSIYLSIYIYIHICI